MPVIKPPWQLLLVTDYHTRLNLDKISDFLIALILSFFQKLLKNPLKSGSCISKMYNLIISSEVGSQNTCVLNNVQKTVPNQCSVLTTHHLLLNYVLSDLYQFLMPVELLLEQDLDRKYTHYPLKPLCTAWPNSKLVNGQLRLWLKREHFKLITLAFKPPKIGSMPISFLQYSWIGHPVSRNPAAQLSPFGPVGKHAGCEDLACCGIS